jgi:hypothetical protein
MTCELLLTRDPSSAYRCRRRERRTPQQSSGRRCCDAVSASTARRHIHRPAAGAPYRPASSRQVAQRIASTLRPVGRRTTSSSRWSSTRSVDSPRRPGTSSSTGAARSRLRPAGGLWRLHAGGGPSDCPSPSGAATRRQCKAAMRETSTATRPALVSVDPQSSRTCASLQFVPWTRLASRTSDPHCPCKPKLQNMFPLFDVIHSVIIFKRRNNLEKNGCCSLRSYTCRAGGKRGRARRRSDALGTGAGDSAGAQRW